MVTVGDGELKPTLTALRHELGLDKQVIFTGFVQYDRLPPYYALAGALVLASTAEQWGLVVNEAMASGLPVLVSDRCGCVDDLVQDGVNGFRFNPTDLGAIADRLEKVAHSATSQQMGQASRTIIAKWTPDRFATALQQAVEAAVRAGSPTACGRA